MGIALVTLGFFLWFALAFNGGIGTDFVNLSFFISALFMIATGAAIIGKSHWNNIRGLCMVALASYLPMVWQRFNFSFGVDWGGLVFDIGIVIFMLILIVKKPNKSLKNGTPESGAP